MEQFFEWLAEHAESLTLIGTVLVAISGGLWTMLQYARAQRQQKEQRIFDTYHKLIHELVHGDADGNVYIDRQCAIIYELRFYRRHYPVTRRILNGMMEDRPQLHPRLRAEIGLTLARTKGRLWNRE